MVMSLHTQKLLRKDVTHEDADRHELCRTECSYYIHIRRAVSPSFQGFLL